MALSLLNGLARGGRTSTWARPTLSATSPKTTLSSSSLSLSSSLSSLSSLSLSSLVARRTLSSSHQQPMQTPLTEVVRDFLDPAEYLAALADRHIDFFTGVPDSLLKDFCGFVSDNVPPTKHIITANEGLAVSTAAGYHMATGKVPLVYMQNSGFGNAVNPLLSLTDGGVYGIPMLVMVGWRGEPGKKDEPQHLIQGKAMPSLLSSMNLQYEVLPDFIEGAQDALDAAHSHFKRRSSPYVLLVRRQCFLPYKFTKPEQDAALMRRERVLELVVELANQWDVLVGTTGFTSRELYEIRAMREPVDHSHDFLTIGSMGHASAIGLGIALGKPSRQVFVLDGDGAALMHLGSMATNGIVGARNLKHIVLNNNAHESVGGQATGAASLDMPAIARGCGYSYAESARTEQEVRSRFAELRAHDGPALLEITIAQGSRNDLGRPKVTPAQNKQQFMEFLRN